MDFVRKVTDFESTRQALASLQRLLYCCQCSQLTKNVCTLGNCEHFFCKQCVEKQLGASCPVCETPAHVRDAQVNRQLSNIVSLSLELGRLLQTHLPKDSEDEDQRQDCLGSTPSTSTTNLVSPGPNHSALQKSSPQQTSARRKQTSASENTRPTDKDGEIKPKSSGSSGEQSLVEDSSSSKRQRQRMRLPQKVAVRKGWGNTGQTTLTQLCDNSPSDESLTDKTDEEDAGVKTMMAPVSKKSLMPQTRVRSKRRQSASDSTENFSGRENDSNQSTLAQFLTDGSMAQAMDVSENSDSGQTSQSGESAVRRRSRQKQRKGTNAAVKENLSKEVFRTPTHSPSSSRSRSGNHHENTGENSSASLTPVPTRRSRTSSSSRETSPKSVPVSSPKTTPRRRSAPVTPTQATPPQSRPSSQKGRKSLPSSLSRSSPVFSASTAKPSAGKKASGGKAGRVKRNAKGETPLHVAAIKGDLSAVRELLNRGDNPNVRDNAGWTPLHEAVNHGHAAVTEALLQRGAMVNIPGLDNDTPLHDAVTNNRLDCVRLLMGYGASVNARNVHGRTVLELAKTEELRAALQQPAAQQQHIGNLPEFEDVEEFRPLCFLGTALTRDQHGLLQKCATKLHAKLVEEYCPEVTHVVSSVNPDGQCPRTLKYLYAVLGGKWIVSIDWVSICLEYGEKVSEEPFEIPGSSTHPNSNAAYEARINRRLQLPALFDGCQMYLHGSFTRLPPNKQELTELLRLGGARLLTREPRLSNLDEYEVTVPYHAVSGRSLVDCGIFNVHDGGSNAPRVEAQRIRSVPASWVVECIATFSLVEPTKV